MRSFLLQIAAVSLINIKSIPQRFWLSLSTVVAVALVVMVLLSFLAMANGFQRTLASSGAEDVAIVLRAGSQAEINSTMTREQVRLIEEGPGIARNADGKPLASAELLPDRRRRQALEPDQGEPAVARPGPGGRRGAQGHPDRRGTHVPAGRQRDGGRQGVVARIPGLGNRPDRQARDQPVDRGRRVRG